MGIAYFIGFCCVGYWIYFSIKKEGLLWIPRVVVSFGGFILWFYLNFLIYTKFGVGFLQVLATVGIMIALSWISYIVNFKIDEIQGVSYEKNPNDKNE